MDYPWPIFTNTLYFLKKIMAFVALVIANRNCSTALGGDLYTVSVFIGQRAEAAPSSEELVGTH